MNAPFLLPWEAMNRGTLLTGRIRAMSSLIASAACSKGGVEDDDISEVMWIVHEMAQQLEQIVGLRQSEGAA